MIYGDQDIVLDVLPTPPTVQINFDQTKPFYVTNNNNNETRLGTFNLIESATIPTNRTYYLSLASHQDIFQVTNNTLIFHYQKERKEKKNSFHIIQLLPDRTLTQIGPYPSDLLQSDNPYVKFTIQAIETTPDKPTRIIQKQFRVPIITNSSESIISFNQSSIFFDTDSGTIIGTFIRTNLTRYYRLELIDTYHGGLALNSETDALILKTPINTLPLLNNQTLLEIKVAVMNEDNSSLSSQTFPLEVTHRQMTDSCSENEVVEELRTGMSPKFNFDENEFKE